MVTETVISIRKGEILSRQGNRGIAVQALTRPLATLSQRRRGERNILLPLEQREDEGRYAAQASHEDRRRIRKE